MAKKLSTRIAILSVIVVPIYYVLICGFLLFLLQFKMVSEELCRLCILRPSPSTYSDGMPMMMGILPEWYLWPSYGMLRSITMDFGVFDAKLAGIIVAGMAPAAIMSLAIYDWSLVPGAAWKSLIPLVPIVFCLGFIGVSPYEPPFTEIGLVLTIAYYAVFIIVFPFFVLRIRRN
jgi:quinol-cytochrome oxidoreductase complex cytochrome b subunit